LATIGSSSPGTDDTVHPGRPGFRRGDRLLCALILRRTMVVVNANLRKRERASRLHLLRSDQ